jgi:hypothetical protein
MRWKLAAILAGGLVLGACASGPDPGDRNQPPPVRALVAADALVFASFDANDDLTIDAGELEAGLAREWARADANADGSLQPIEYGAWAERALGGAQSPPFRLDVDRNVDNVISEQEFRTEFNARAAEYDRDADGNLTRAEFLRAAPGARVLEEQTFFPNRDETERRRRPPN